jgi:diguanylate cyclase (GGDEF)-like protein
MDRHTLFTTQATLLIFLGVSVLLSRRAYRWQSPDSSSQWFSAGYILGGLGLLLQAWRGEASPWLTIILGNFLFMLVMPCMNRAIGEVIKQDTRRAFYLMLGINILTVANYAYFTFVRPNLLLRNVEACIVMILMTSINVAAVLRSTDEVIKPAIRLLFALMSIHIFSSGLRMVVLLLHRYEWFSVLGMITIVGIAITFMWVDALRLRAELEERAMIDPLTALFNRRALELVAPRELNRAARRGQPCSALMIDIDRFKDINDGMGHAAGDATLCAVAGALRACLRETDTATRLGGDEFFVLLPDADEDTTELVVARIRIAIDQLRMQTMGGQTFTVAVSIGQITEHKSSTTIEDLLHASDIMLYREKQLRSANHAARSSARYSDTGGAHVQPSRA